MLYYRRLREGKRKLAPLGCLCAPFYVFSERLQPVRMLLEFFLWRARNRMLFSAMNVDLMEVIEEVLQVTVACRVMLQMVKLP